MQNFQMVGGELDAILYGFGYNRWRDIMSARLHHQDRSRRHAPLLLSSVLCNRVLQSKRILLFSCLDTRIGTASNDDWIRSAIQSQQVSQIAIDQCHHKLPTAGWDGRQKKRKKIDPGKLHPPIAIYGTAASAWTWNFYRRIGLLKVCDWNTETTMWANNFFSFAHSIQLQGAPSEAGNCVSRPPFHNAMHCKSSQQSRPPRKPTPAITTSNSSGTSSDFPNWFQVDGLLLRCCRPDSIKQTSRNKVSSPDKKKRQKSNVLLSSGPMRRATDVW